MKARDIDVTDANMMRMVARREAERETYAARHISGRLIAIADFLERHIPELAECEHGALKGRCIDGLQLCEPENFEADHIVNRAQSVADLADDMGLAPAVETLSFVDTDFRELLAFAWVGARVLHAAQHHVRASAGEAGR